MTNVRTNGSVNNSGVTMVWVAGMQVPESKVQARLAALAHGRRIHQEMIETQRELHDEETRELIEKGWTPAEINCMFSARHIADLESRGFGKSKRVVRIQRPA